MMITRDNYESFFLDFLEGNLDEEKIDQLLDFLSQNPDLKEELHQFENIRLTEEPVAFSGKGQLYKTEADRNAVFENKAVAYLEGDLDADGRTNFETYLAAHPELGKEYHLFTRTRLTPDAGIKYPDKKKLYHKSGTTIAMNWVARAAAVVVLLWGINSLINNSHQPETFAPKTEMAEIKPKTLPQGNMIEPGKNMQETVAPKKTVAVGKTNAARDIVRKQAPKRTERKPDTESVFVERDLTILAQITPISAQLENEPDENQLAVSRSVNVEKINDPRNIMTLEEFLASRVKKVSGEGLLSFQRIARVGLELASEISGERIGYKTKDGKISSIDFESKLMAFSIPLKKE